MDKNNLIKIINKELTIVSELISDFSSSADIHPFEIDLALSKIKDIYGELQLLKDNTKPIKNLSEKDTKQQSANNNIVDIKDEQEYKPNIAENTNAKDVEITSPEPKENIDTETKNETIKHENEQSCNEVVVSEKENDTEHHKGEKQTEQKSEPDNILSEQDKTENLKEGIIADKFSNMSPSVNDMLSGFKKSNNLANKLSGKPLTSLKKEVKLNDKIWFINELFDKNADLYNTTIDAIDSSDNLDQALSELFPKFNWNQDKKSTINFLELVFRRFS